MVNLIDAYKKYALNRSWRFHTIFTSIFLVLFVSIIAGGFVPTTMKIEESGFSTTDLQNASTREETEIILTAFEPLMKFVKLLSVLDYLFILLGFILFLSLNAMIYKALMKYDKLTWIPLSGVLLTIISRTLDSLENLWSILIYTNPDDFSVVLLPLSSVTGLVKWIFVGFEYSMVLVGLICFLILRNKDSAT